MQRLLNASGKISSLVLFCGLLLTVTTTICVFSRAHRSEPMPAASVSKSEFARIHPSPISFGVVKPRDVVSVSALIRNVSPGPLAIERFETSCGCIRIEPSSPVPFVIEKARDALIQITFDGSEDPGFQGGLSVQVSVWGSDKQIVARTHVDLTVRADALGCP